MVNFTKTNAILLKSSVEFIYLRRYVFPFILVLFSHINPKSLPNAFLSKSRYSFLVSQIRDKISIRTFLYNIYTNYSLIL
jgi:hypothetical protein